MIFRDSILVDADVIIATLIVNTPASLILLLKL
jgi:hypothetical protein